MVKVILEFSNADARRMAYFLRKLYGKDGRTGFKWLCMLAVRKEALKQAQKEVEEIEEQEK